MAIDRNSLIKEAQKFAAKNQFDKAITEWKKLLKESPNDSNIYNTIGDLCLKKGAKADAVETYRKAADLLAADGFTSKAIALYKKVLNIDPKKIEIHLALGDLNAEKGLTGAAIESYKIVADYYTREKNMVMALGSYQKMADLSPSNVTFRVKLADMYAKEGMTAEAAKAYLNAADAHMSKSAFQDARQLFEKVLSLDPDNKEVYYKAGVVYLKEGKFVEACKALKHAFENDPSNQDLVETYLEALHKTDKPAEVEAVLKTLVEKTSKKEFRKKLYYFYLSNKEYEKALAEASTLVQAKRGHGEDEAAEKLLKNFVLEAPQFAPGHQKLAEFYISNTQTEDAVKEFLQAADLLVEEEKQEESKALLIHILERIPGRPEVKDRLRQLEETMIAPAMPEPGGPAPSEVLEMPGQAPPAAEPVEEEIPAISDACMEADVLIKYGLAAKATEQLEEVAAQYPENARVRIKLRDLYREQGNIEKAVKHTLVLVDIFLKRGTSDKAETELQTALDMDPNNPLVLSKLRKAPDAATEAPPAEIASIQPLAPTTFEEAPPILEPAPVGTEEGSIAFEGLDTQLPSVDETSSVETPTEEAPLIMKQPQAPEIHPEQPGDVDLNEIWAEAEFYYQQGLFDEAKKHYAKIIGLSPSDRRAIERLAEISLEEDETREFSKLADAVEDLENAVPAGGPADGEEGELATSSSDEDAVRSLMKEIEEMKKEQKSTPPPPQKIAPAQKGKRFEAPQVESPAASAKEPALDESFFDLGAELEKEASSAAVIQQQKTSPEDFFDLAAELRDDLSNLSVTTGPSVAQEDQSLDDIFEEFKKGVEQQALQESTDTHYNLGVAYKEMGLLNEAISEFIITPEGEAMFIQSRYMLGLCYMEQGEYQKAIGEIYQALNYAMSKGIDDQSRINMQYDLGLAYQGLGNIKDAIEEFQQVYNIDRHYRDVAAKLKELQQGEYISFEHLKEDIEKEISAKFLEEGERIEREEKSRKSERIKTETA